MMREFLISMNIMGHRTRCSVHDMQAEGKKDNHQENKKMNLIKKDNERSRQPSQGSS